MTEHTPPTELTELEQAFQDITADRFAKHCAVAMEAGHPIEYALRDHNAMRIIQEQATDADVQRELNDVDQLPVGRQPVVIAALHVAQTNIAQRDAPDTA